MKANKLNSIKSSGFKVPKDYLESFEDNFFDAIANNNLNSIKDNGFQVPETYFDSLEDKIIGKLSKENYGKVIPLYNKKSVRLVASVAAAVLIMLFFGPSLFNNKPTFDNLQTETVENYIIEDLSSYEIASLLSEEQLKHEIFVNSEIKNENLETYLLDNLDVEDLIVE